MRLRVSKPLLKPADGLPAHGILWPQHIKGVHIGRIHIHSSRNAAGIEPLDIANRLRIKGLAIANKGICGRKTIEIRQTGGGGIGGKFFLSCPRR